MPKKKLPPIPKPTTKTRQPKADDRGAKSNPQAADAPNLDHIAEQLRPLARPIGELEFLPVNPRSHDEENIKGIQASLRNFGQYAPVIVNKRKSPPVVVAGNGRLKAALLLGWTHIAALELDLSDDQEALLAVVDNRTAETADWDTEALDQVLRLCQTTDQELAGMLTELAEAQDLIPPDEPPATGEGPEPQLNRADELQKQWRVERGQLWEIPSKTVDGKCHRLLCGDSTSAEDVGRVMGGERAAGPLVPETLGTFLKFSWMACPALRHDAIARSITS